MEGRPDGARDTTGKISGTYLHGMFSDDDFRRVWLAQFGVAQSVNYQDSLDKTLNDLADHVETHMDVDGLFALAS